MTKYFFETINEIREHIGNVTAAFSYEEIRPDLQTACEKILRNNQGMGVTYFDALLAKYNSGPDKLTPAEKVIVNYIRGVVSNFAYMMYLPKAIVNIGASGATQAKGEGRDSARKWQIVELQKTYMVTGYEKLETLLLFLEQQTSGVDQWKSSDAYTVYKEGFINTVEAFASEYPAMNTRRTFMAIRSLQRIVEEYQVKKIIGDTLYTSLKTKIKDSGTFTNPEKATLKIIRSYVAWATMADALPQLPFTINEKGVMLQSTGMTLENSELMNPTDPARLDKLAKSADMKAKFFQDELIKDAGKTISKSQDDNDITNHVYWV